MFEATVTATLFSDPMMGLAYECESALDGLARALDGRLELTHAMVVLVRDVADFMDEDELALPAAEGIARYTRRLARIYLSEVEVGGLPVRMDGFRLFDEGHRSSLPLCLAFEAARIASPERAEAYLRAMRRATVVEGRQTAREGVTREVAAECGIDLEAFDRALRGGAAREALRADEALAASLGVRALPALLVQTMGRAVLTTPLAGLKRLRELVGDMQAS